MNLSTHSSALIATLETNDIRGRLTEIAEAVKALSEKVGRAQPKLTLHYKEPVILRVGKKRSPLTRVSGWFFEVTGNGLFFRQGKRSGYRIELFQPEAIDRIEYTIENPAERELKEAVEAEAFFKKVQAKRYDETTWTALRVDSFPNGRKFYDIRKTFDCEDLREIERAFRDKSKFRFRRYADHKNGRDYSVSGALQEDGSYQAWFSSEYSGCGNGDYYALLNPTTAVFLETD